jgi:transaldolase
MEVERAARIAAIKQHPAWDELIAEIDETYEKYAAALAKTMMATGEPYPDFEYKRGYLAGLKALTRYPETATKLVSADAEKQRAEAEEAHSE